MYSSRIKSSDTVVSSTPFHTRSFKQAVVIKETFDNETLSPVLLRQENSLTTLQSGISILQNRVSTTVVARKVSFTTVPQAIQYDGKPDCKRSLECMHRKSVNTVKDLVDSEDDDIFSAKHLTTTHKHKTNSEEVESEIAKTGSIKSAAINKTNVNKDTVNNINNKENMLVKDKIKNNKGIRPKIVGKLNVQDGNAEENINHEENVPLGKKINNTNVIKNKMLKTCNVDNHNDKQNSDNEENVQVEEKINTKKAKKSETVQNSNVQNNLAEEVNDIQLNVVQVEGNLKNKRATKSKAVGSNEVNNDITDGKVVKARRNVNKKVTKSNAEKDSSVKSNFGDYDNNKQTIKKRRNSSRLKVLKQENVITGTVKEKVRKKAVKPLASKLINNSNPNLLDCGIEENVDVNKIKKVKKSTKSKIVKTAPSLTPGEDIINPGFSEKNNVDIEIFSSDSLNRQVKPTGRPRRISKKTKKCSINQDQSEDENKSLIIASTIKNKKIGLAEKFDSKFVSSKNDAIKIRNSNTSDLKLQPNVNIVFDKDVESTARNNIRLPTKTRKRKSEDNAQESDKSTQKMARHAEIEGNIDGTPTSSSSLLYENAIIATESKVAMPPSYNIKEIDCFSTLRPNKKNISNGVAKSTGIFVENKIVAGHIFIQPGKSYKNISSNNNTHLVMKGTLCVTIFQNFKIVKANEFFFVPSCVPYKIENCGTEKSVLCFMKTL